MEVQLAFRDSKTATRPYVIVNPLLAKHLAAKPSAALDYFYALAEKVDAAITKDEKVLVIGFAETATAVGAAVAEYIGADCYVHTTREERDSELLAADFLEEHSHAKNQELYLKEEYRDLSLYNRIVFVEDEITTGKTILNFLKNISLNLGNAVRGQDYKGKFIVAALLFNNFDSGIFEDYDAEFFCLQKILEPLAFEQTRQRETETIKAFSKNTAEIPSFSPTENENEQAAKCETVTALSVGTKAAQQLFSDTRLGVEPRAYKKACETSAENVKAEICLNEQIGANKTVLVLGTEEFMYPALILGRKFEEEGCAVKTHSTTRSPLAPNDSEGYPIKTRAAFKSPYDNDRETYLYNLNSYDLVIVFTDARKDGENENMKSLLKELERGGNRKIYFVRIVYEN